ncbi:hypothetical protein MA16_Dca003047 [Dendrobium catenatum]|uniref:Uncharacterized protein n=1 Tax=Dendrobium catenatum TaxID=906689 RepID=A0A2I0X9G4_9ASPA|nr:hypothetical protein MA16_Dca003047 [Dendrobium catenatum]
MNDLRSSKEDSRIAKNETKEPDPSLPSCPARGPQARNGRSGNPGLTVSSPGIARLPSSVMLPESHERAPDATSETASLFRRATRIARASCT